MNSNCIFKFFSRLDSITYNHSVRVAALSVEFERYNKMDNTELSQAALVHDLGKVFISSKILDKVGKLTDLEREIINLHPYIGYQLLKSMDVDENICRIVLYHHGFDPLLLSPVGNYDNRHVCEKSVMLHTIDAFEALTSDRPYHRGFPSHEALDIMCKEEGHHPEVMKYLRIMSNSSNPCLNTCVRRTCQQVNCSFINDLLIRCTA